MTTLRTLGLAAAAAFALGACQERQSTQSSAEGPSAQAKQSQQEAEQALDRASDAQKKASSEQEQAQSARQDVEQTRQELTQAEQRAKEEEQQSAQAQQQAQQEGQAAQQQAQQSQQQAATAQQQAQQQSEQEQQQYAQQTQQQADQQQQAQAQPVGGAAGAGQELQGSVVSVADDRLVIHSPDKGRFDLYFGDQSEVTIDGQKTTPDQLAHGHEIRATYQLEGQKRMATRIEAQTATGGSGEQQ